MQRKKKLSLLEELIPERVCAFKLLNENAFSCLKVFLFNAELEDYQKFQVWLERKHGIKGQIDSENRLGLVFKSAEMSIMMAFYLFEFCSSIFEYNFNAIDLAVFVIKLHQFIDNKKHKNIYRKLSSILFEIYNDELSNFRYMNSLALSLSLPPFPEPSSPKISSNDSFEVCQTVLKEMVLFHATSTSACCKLLDEISLFMSHCNEIAYQATVAMNKIQDITNEHSLEVSCLLNAFYKSDMTIIQRMHIDANEVLAPYLRKFKLPEVLIEKCATVKYDINKSNRSSKKYVSDPFDYRSQPLVKITSHDIRELDLRVAELKRIKNIGQEILTNYEKFRDYVQNVPCVIVSLFPEKSELLSPLFHQYNSYRSPLVAALSDKKLDQNANLQLFSDLSKAMPYQQTKLNVSIYGEGAWHNSEFMSPLCYAVEYAIPSVIRILLENNATVNPIDNRYTPLHRAMKRGNHEIVKLLLEFGARPDMVTDDDRYTALHHAQNAACAGYLIDWVITHSAKYPDINPPEFIDARDRYGNTPLHRVSQRKVFARTNNNFGNNSDDLNMKSQQHLELLRVLIENRANVDAVSHSGHSSLHYVLMVHSAQRYSEVHFPTITAAVKMLVGAGANVNIISRDGLNLSPQKPFQIFSPLLGLFDSSYHGGSAFSKKSISQSYLYEVCEMLVNHGAIINIFDEKLNTPLMKSILFSAVNSVDFLLKNGANPNLRSNKRMPTALHYAMKMSNGLKKAISETQAIRYLFKAGASPLLLMDRTLKITAESLKIDTFIMQLILSQENEFSQSGKILQMTDKEETIQERFVRIWTVMNVQEITINVRINALEYCYFDNGSNHKPHPAVVTLFNEWFDFYRSSDVKGLLNVLCRSSLYMNISDDLIILLARHFSQNPNQIKLLETWVISGRLLTRAQENSQHSSSAQVLVQQNFFSQEMSNAISPSISGLENPCNK